MVGMEGVVAKLLVAGASGVVGSAVVEHVLNETDWDVVALSRRAPRIRADRPVEHVAVDLRDRSAVASVVAGLTDVTHLVFAALYEKPGLVEGWTEADQMQTNATMFANLLDALVASPGLEHVSLMQGTKAYGAHLHPIPVPARESAPRDEHPNFYFLQEDHLREVAGRHGLRWTVLRPQVVMGGAVGAAMNLVPVLGAYAAICREAGEPFSFPGGASYVWEAVDARLCAEALLWCAQEPAADGEIYNLANGDVFEWRNLWPAVAAAVGATIGPDRRFSMVEFLASHSETWDAVVRRHHLEPQSLHELLGESAHYADLCFNLGELDEVFPRFVSTVKIRQAGFTGCYDTQDTMRYWLRRLASENLLPDPTAGGATAQSTER
jgi:nucleoside-diphosphate-sugar epimerase